MKMMSALDADGKEGSEVGCAFVSVRGKAGEKLRMTKNH